MIDKLQLLRTWAACGRTLVFSHGVALVCWVVLPVVLVAEKLLKRGAD